MVKALRVTPEERAAVLERDHWACVRCGHQDPSGATLQVDHVRPKAEWGPAHDLSEYQTLCAFGTGGCHREKSKEEAAERAARRRGERVAQNGGPMKKAAPKKTPPRVKRGRVVIGWLIWIGAAVACGLWAMSWLAGHGIIRRSTYETTMHGVETVLLTGLGVAVVLAVAAVLILRHRSNRSNTVDRLNATLAKVYGYSTGVRSIEVHKADRSGPVEWTVNYPETNADEDPAWAPRMIMATTARVGFPVVLVSLDVLHDRIRVRKARPGESVPTSAPVAESGSAHGAAVERIVEGAVAELKVKDKERARVVVNVVEWRADGDPAKFALRYPAGVATHKGDMRVDLEDKMADLFPNVRWGAVWVTKNDTVQFNDLGPDPLAAIVAIFPLADPERAALDPVAWLSNVRIGRREDGSDWTLRLWQNHILVAGATGSGKGSVLWSIIRHLLPLRAAGLVRLVGIDPKGGMEFGPGRPLFDVYVDRRSEILPRLRRLAEDMERRQNEITASGIGRKNIPTKQRPHVVVFVDELAFLSAYMTDPKERAEAISLMAQILTQGRAPGYTFIGAAQDPSKDTLPLRQLFPTRVGLRLDEATQVTMALGEQARRRGARCNLIRPDMQGTGYAYVEDSDDPANGTVVRGRAGFVTDPDIGEMVTWAAGVKERQVAHEAAHGPVPARELREQDRITLELDGVPTPVSTLGVETEHGSTVIDYVTDATGEPGSIEVDDGEMFDRA